MTHDEIRSASTAKLRRILKEDIPVELDDMINYELYIREYSQSAELACDSSQSGTLLVYKGAMWTIIST